MKATTRRAKILGFSGLETALFEELSERPTSVSDLARRLKKPRTSLFEPLKSLHKRGFVEPTKIGKRTWWKKVSQESLTHSLGTALLSGIIPGDAPAHPEFFLHQGKQALSKIYYQLGDCKKERVLFIQPNASLASSLKAFTQDDLVEINTRIKKSSVIMETILQENVIPHWAEAIKKKGWSVEKVLRAVEGRAADTTYVPKEFLNFNSEIIVMPKVAYIVNWDRLVAIEIHNQETLGLLREIFAFAKHFGHKVNLNELVARQHNNKN